MAAPATPSSEWRFYLSQDVDLQVRPPAACSRTVTALERSAAASVSTCASLVYTRACPASICQVRVRIGSVFGVLPHARCSHDDVGGPRPSAACVEACLVAGGEVLGLEARTTYAEVASEGAVWSEWLTFCIKARETTKKIILGCRTAGLLSRPP